MAIAMEPARRDSVGAIIFGALLIRMASRAFIVFSIIVNISYCPSIWRISSGLPCSGYRNSLKVKEECQDN